MKALQAGDSATAFDWLRLREYRQATKFSLVDNPAAQAIARLQGGSGNLDEVLTTVSNDLRDAYTFRLRDALSKLKDAAGAELHGPLGRLVGAVNGYFGILQADFTTKRGDSETTALQQQLTALKTAALKGDLTAVGTLDDQIKDALANYEPVALTADDIAKRAQLLYLFIDSCMSNTGAASRTGRSRSRLRCRKRPPSAIRRRRWPKNCARS